MGYYYYICTYSDYSELPDILFYGNTPGEERTSVNGEEFIVHSDSSIGEYDLSWMTGDEEAYSYGEILTAVSSPYWGDME